MNSIPPAAVRGKLPYLLQTTSCLTNKPVLFHDGAEEDL